MTKQETIAQRLRIVLESVEKGQYAIADDPNNFDIDTFRDDMDEVTEDME